ncbi:MAG TPA: site-2 protease family protein [Dehalococcoidia bacterium]|nr:site-2 protease family protein [Dehalococcoidia bacterium]
MDVLLYSILPFVVILLGLVVIHEAGHYVTAKLLGVKVLEAGIGIPPKIWGFKWRDTEYSINALPLGAFVRMLGEEDPTDPQSLAAQAKWKRTVIIGSGAFLNIVVAVILFSVALMVPHAQSVGGAKIAEVAPNGPAAHAGLQAGDQIKSVNGRQVKSYEDASYLIRLYQGQHIDFTVLRPDAASGSAKLVHVDDVYARWNPQPYADACGVEHDEGPTGITVTPGGTYQVPRSAADVAKLRTQSISDYQTYKEQTSPGAPAACGASGFGFHAWTAAQCAGFGQQQQADARALKQQLFADTSQPCWTFEAPPATQIITHSVHQAPLTAFKNGSRTSFESLILMRNQIWSLARGFTGSSPITGPVGIAQATGEVVHQAGWQSLILLAASISMSLGVLNFLPIPMLDGGRLMFIFIEFIRGGRRIAPEKEALVHFVGLVAMLALFAVVTYFDILRIVSGGSLLR